MTTISSKEDKLIMAARLLDEEQLDFLVEFVNSLIIKKRAGMPSFEEKNSFLNTLENIRSKAHERGITPEILEQMLREDD